MNKIEEAMLLKNLDFLAVADDLKDLTDPTSLLYRDPEHIKDIENRYGLPILTLAKAVDKARQDGRI